MRSSAAVTALVVALCLAGCQGEGAAPDDPASADSATSSQAREPYDAELSVVPGADPEGPQRLTLENTGTRRDRYLVRLSPSTGGRVAPDRAELAPGETELLQLGQGQSDEPVTVTAYSLGRSEVLATLELAAAE